MCQDGCPYKCQEIKLKPKIQVSWSVGLGFSQSLCQYQPEFGCKIFNDMYTTHIDKYIDVPRWLSIEVSGYINEAQNTTDTTEWCSKEYSMNNNNLQRLSELFPQ